MHSWGSPPVGRRSYGPFCEGWRTSDKPVILDDQWPASVKKMNRLRGSALEDVPEIKKLANFALDTINNKDPEQYKALLESMSLS